MHHLQLPIVGCRRIFMFMVASARSLMERTRLYSRAKTLAKTIWRA